MARTPFSLSRPLPQALALAVAGAALGLGANALRADGLPLDRPVLATGGASAAASCEAPGAVVVDVDFEEACRLRAAGAVFVDARPASAYAAGHVEGAIHLPSRGDCPDAEEAIARLRAAPAAVIYDADGTCALSRHLAERLVARGVKDVRILSGGFPGWCAADGPAQSGGCAACEHAARETR